MAVSILRAGNGLLIEAGDGSVGNVDPIPATGRGQCDDCSVELVVPTTLPTHDAFCDGSDGRKVLADTRDVPDLD